jgi:hypothetical protein
MAMSQHEKNTGHEVLDASLNPTASVALKDGAEEMTAVEVEESKTPPVSYPQSWKLWAIYIATLFTMFLVPLDMVRLEPLQPKCRHILTSSDDCCNRHPQNHSGLSEPG